MPDGQFGHPVVSAGSACAGRLTQTASPTASIAGSLPSSQSATASPPSSAAVTASASAPSSTPQGSRPWVRPSRTLEIEPDSGHCSAGPDVARSTRVSCRRFGAHGFSADIASTIASIVVVRVARAAACSWLTYSSPTQESVRGQDHLPRALPGDGDRGGAQVGDLGQSEIDRTEPDQRVDRLPRTRQVWIRPITIGGSGSAFDPSQSARITVPSQ